MGAHEVEIIVKFEQLITHAKAASHAPALVWECCDWGSLRHKITMPVTLKRSGLNVRLIVQSPQYEIKRNVDVRMVKLLSKSHRYFDLLSTGKVKSIKEIGDQEKLSPTHVSRVMYLAFLAPDIVRKILDGKYPPSLTSDKLMHSLPLPVDWVEQRVMPGFS